MSRHVMNNMQTVMDAILRAGRPLHESEIALMTGMDPVVIRRTIENSLARKYLTRIPAQFKVNPVGAASVEAAKEGKRAPGRPMGYKPRASRKVIDDEAPPSPNGIVESALANRDPLAMAWGGACNV